MARDVTYDDAQLRALFNELSPKAKRTALRGGFRGVANKFRRQVIGNLRTSIHSGSDLEKGVRALVFKQQLGFRVTVGTQVKRDKATRRVVSTKGFHVNRRGFEKPVLIWAEDGTKDRRTGRIRGGKRHGAYRGSMRRYAFVDLARRQFGASVMNELKKSLVENTIRTAKRYGCI